MAETYESQALPPAASVLVIRYGLQHKAGTGCVETSGGV